MSRRGPKEGGDAAEYAAQEIMPAVYKAIDKLLENKDMWDRHAAQTALQEAEESHREQQQRDGGIQSPRGGGGTEGDSNGVSPVLAHVGAKHRKSLDGAALSQTGSPAIEYDTAHVPFAGSGSLTTHFRKALYNFHPDRFHYERSIVAPRKHALQPTGSAPSQAEAEHGVESAEPDPTSLDASGTGQSVAASDQSPRGAVGDPLSLIRSQLPLQYVVNLTASRKRSSNLKAAVESSFEQVPTITLGASAVGMSASYYSSNGASMSSSDVPSTPSYQIHRCGELPVYLCPTLPFYRSEMRKFVRDFVSTHEPEATHITFVVASTPGLGVYMKADTLLGSDGSKRKSTGTGYSSYYEAQQHSNAALSKAKGKEKILCFAEVIGERYGAANLGVGVGDSNADGFRPTTYQSSIHPLFNTDGGRHIVLSEQSMASLWNLAERDLQQRDAAIQAKQEADAEANNQARIEKRKQLEAMLKQQQDVKEKAKVGKILGEDPADSHHEQLAAVFSNYPSTSLASHVQATHMDGLVLDEEETNIANLSGLSPRSFGIALNEERETIEASAKFLAELGIDPARMDDLETEEFMLIRRLTHDLEQSRRESCGERYLQTQKPPGLSLTMSSTNSGGDAPVALNRKSSTNPKGRGRQLLRSIVKEILARKKAEKDDDPFDIPSTAGESLSSAPGLAAAASSRRSSLVRSKRGSVVSAVASFNAAKGGPLAMCSDNASGTPDTLSDELVEVAVLKRLFPADRASREARREQRRIEKERKAEALKAERAAAIPSSASANGIVAPQALTSSKNQPLRRGSVVISGGAGQRRSSMTDTPVAMGMATSALKGSRAGKTVKVGIVTDETPKAAAPAQPKKQVSLADTVLDALRAKKEREEKKLVEVGTAVWELRDACFKYRCGILGIAPGGAMAGSSTEEESDDDGDQTDFADSAMCQGRFPPTFEVTRVVHPQCVPLSSRAADTLFSIFKRGTDIQEGRVVPQGVAASSSRHRASEASRSVVVIVGLSEVHAELVRHFGTLACTYHTVHSELKAVSRVYNTYDHQPRNAQYVVDVQKERSRVVTQRKLRDARRAQVKRELEDALKLVQQLESPEDERRRLEREREVLEARSERRQRIDENLAAIDCSQRNSAAVTIQSLIRGVLLRLRLRSGVCGSTENGSSPQVFAQLQRAALWQRDLRRGRFPVVMKALEYLSHTMGPNMVCTHPPRRNVPREVPFWSRTLIKVAPPASRLVNHSLIKRHLQSIPRPGLDLEVDVPPELIGETVDVLSVSTQSAAPKLGKVVRVPPLISGKDHANRTTAIGSMNAHDAALCTSNANLLRQLKEAAAAKSELQRVCGLPEDVSSEDEEWEAKVTQRIVPDQRCPFCPLGDAIAAMYAADVCNGTSLGRTPPDLLFLLEASSGEMIKADGVQRKAARILEKLIGYMYFAAFCATRCKLDAGYSASPHSHASFVFLQVPSKLHPMDTFASFVASLGAPLAGWLAASPSATLHALSSAPRKLLYGQRLLVGGPLVNGKWIADSIADHPHYQEGKRQRQMGRLIKHQLELWEQTQTLLLRDRQQKDYDTLSRSRGSSSVAPINSPMGRKSRTASRAVGSVHVGRSMRGSVSSNGRASLGLDEATTQAGGGISAMLASMLGGGRFSVRADFEHALYNVVNETDELRVSKVVRSWNVPLSDAQTGAAETALGVQSARGGRPVARMPDDHDDDHGGGFGTVIGNLTARAAKAAADSKPNTKKEKFSESSVYALPLYEPLASRALLDAFNAAALCAVPHPVRRNMLQPRGAEGNRRSILPAGSVISNASPTTLNVDTGYAALAHLLPPPFYIVPECVSTEQWEEVAADILNNEAYRSMCGTTSKLPLGALGDTRGSLDAANESNGGDTADSTIPELNMTHKRILWFSTNPNPVVYCNGTPLYAIEPTVRVEGDAPSQTSLSANSSPTDVTFSGAYEKLDGTRVPMFIPRCANSRLSPASTLQSGGPGVSAPTITASFGGDLSTELPSAGTVLLNTASSVAGALDVCMNMDRVAKQTPTAALYRDPTGDSISGQAFPLVEAPLLCLGFDPSDATSASPAPSLNVTARRAILARTGQQAAAANRRKGALLLSDIESALLEDVKAVAVRAHRGAVPFVFPCVGPAVGGSGSGPLALPVPFLQPLPLATLVSELTPVPSTKSRTSGGGSSAGSFSRMKRNNHNRQSQHFGAQLSSEMREEESFDPAPSSSTIPPGKVFSVALRNGWSIKLTDLTTVYNAPSTISKAKPFKGSSGEDGLWRLLVGVARGRMSAAAQQYQSGLMKVISENKTVQPRGAPVSNARRLAAAWSTLFPLDPTEASFIALPFDLCTRVPMQQANARSVREDASRNVPESMQLTPTAQRTPKLNFDGIPLVHDDEDSTSPNPPARHSSTRSASPDGGSSPTNKPAAKSASPSATKSASPSATSPSYSLPVVPDPASNCAYTVSTDFMRASECLAGEVIALAEERAIVERAPESPDECFRTVGQVVRDISDLLSEYPQCTASDAPGTEAVPDDIRNESLTLAAGSPLISSNSFADGSVRSASAPFRYHRIPMLTCDGGLNTTSFSELTPTIPKAFDELYTNMLSGLDERRTAFVFSVHDGFQTALQGVDALSGSDTINSPKKSSSSATKPAAKNLTWNASKDGCSSLLLAVAGALVYECDMLSEYRKVAAAEQQRDVPHSHGLRTSTTPTRVGGSGGPAVTLMKKGSLPPLSSSIDNASGRRYQSEAPSGRYFHTSFLDRTTQGTRERLKPWQLFPVLDRLAAENPKLQLHDAMRTVDAVLVATDLHRFFFDDVAFSVCMRLLGALPSNISMRHIATEEAQLRAAEAKVAKSRVAKEAAEKRISKDDSAAAREAFRAHLDKEELEELNQIYPEERRQRVCQVKRQYVGSQILQRWLRVLMPGSVNGTSAAQSSSAGSPREDPFLLEGPEDGAFEGEELDAADVLGGTTVASQPQSCGGLVSVLSITGRSSRAAAPTPPPSRPKSSWQLLTVRDCSQRFEMYVHLVLFCAFVKSSVPQRKLSAATGKPVPRYVLFLEHSSSLKASFSYKNGVSPWEPPAPSGRTHRLQNSTSCDDLNRLLFLADHQRLEPSDSLDGPLATAAARSTGVTPKDATIALKKDNSYTRRGSVAYHMGGALVQDHEDSDQSPITGKVHTGHALQPKGGGDKAYFFQDSRRERYLSEQERCSVFLQAFHPLSLHEAAYLQPFSTLDADAFHRQVVWESYHKPHPVL